MTQPSVPNDRRAEDTLLVERCLAGDERACRAIYDAHVDRLYRHAAMIVGPSVDVEEVVQKTFLAAFRKLGTWDSSRCQLSTWLHGFLIRTAANARQADRRKNRAIAALGREQAAVARPTADRLEQNLELRDKATWLHAQLERLPVKSRTALVLYYFEELEIEEVAARLDASVGSTWARIERARRRLADVFSRKRRAASLRRSTP